MAEMARMARMASMAQDGFQEPHIDRSSSAVRLKLVRALAIHSPSDCHNLGGNLAGRGILTCRGGAQASGRRGGEIPTILHGSWLLTAIRQIGPQETLARTLPTNYGNRLASYIKQIADLTTRIYCIML